MSDKQSSLWNMRSSDDDDDDDRGASSSSKRSSPFYSEDDDYDDEDFDEEEENEAGSEDKYSSSSYRSSSYGTSSFGSGSSRPTSSSSTSSRYGSGSSYGGSGSSYSAGGSYGSSGSGSTYGTGSSYGSTGTGSGASRPTTGSGSSSTGKYASSSPHRTESPPTGAKESSSDKKGGRFLGRFGGGKSEKKPAEKKSGSDGGRLNSLKKRFSRGGDSQGSRASATGTVSRSGATSSGKPGEHGQKDKGKSRFSFSLPFKRGEKSEKSGRTDRPSTPHDVKKARPLPSRSKQPQIRHQGLSLDRKLDIAGVALLIGAAIISLGAISSNRGDVSRALLELLYQIVGIGWLAIPLALGGVGLWLLWRHFGDVAPEANYEHLVGWVIVYFAFLTTAQYIHLLTTPVISIEQLYELSDQTVRAGQGGGWFGHQIYMLLMRSIGEVGTPIALLGWWGIGLIVATDISFADIFRLFGRGQRAVVNRYRSRRADRAAAQRSLAAGLSGAAVVESLPQPAATVMLGDGAGQKALPAAETLSLDQESRAQPYIRYRGRERDTAEVVPAVPASTADQPALYGAQSSPPLDSGRATSAPTSTGYRSTKAPAPAASGPVPLRPGSDPLRIRRPPAGLDLDAPADEDTDLDDEEEIVSVAGDDQPDGETSPEVSSQPPDVRPRLIPPVPYASTALSDTGRISQEKDASSEILFTGVKQAPTPAKPAPAPSTPPASSAPPAPRPAPPFTLDDDRDDDLDEKENYDEDEAITDETFDTTFMRPAQPRNTGPVTVRPLHPAGDRAPGAGLSPAERAAFMGDFASKPDVEDENGEENDNGASEVISTIGLASRAAAVPLTPARRSPIQGDPFAEEEDDLADEDETVYEPLDSADYPDDLPVVDLDEGEAIQPGRQDEPPVDTIVTPTRPPVRSAAVPPPPAATPVIPPARPPSATPAPATPARTQPERKTSPAEESAAPFAAERPASGAPAAHAEPVIPETPYRPQYTVPDFHTILEPVTEQNINDEVLLDRARIIEDTLMSFGAPGKVVEVNPGPVITQFGVEPDYVEARGGRRTRVKVQAIARLADDLALSLAARSIRIEAPVPGKGFVGIEVPNGETSLVSLRDVMESPEYARINSKLRIGLGQSVDGTPVVADLTAMPHLLIAGTTGSGKSVCVNAIIACLLLQNTPDDMQLIMVDPKRVELTGYNGIPHLVAPVVVELERIVGVLKWVTREMDDRYRYFNERGARNILTYNNMLGPNEKPLPYLIVIVDELADLMMLAPDETERVLTRLAQMSRATGIHLIISTQRPSVDVVTGLIKANFPARIAFAVASSVDSRVILDQPGAERLLGRGDMLFQAPDAAAPSRLQGVFVSDTELTRLVNYWKGIRTVEGSARPPTRLDAGQTGTPGTPRAATPVRSRAEKYGAPGAPTAYSARPATPMASSPASTASAFSSAGSFWERGASTPADRTRDTDDLDELYDESVAVVRRLRKASVSLLQRQLRIGYTRAARLIDVMEERGVVGPAQSGSKPRKVIGYSDDDIDLDDEDDDEISELEEEYEDDEDDEI